MKKEPLLYDVVELFSWIGIGIILFVVSSQIVQLLQK